MKYICLMCDTEFYEEEGLILYKEPHPELDGCPTETIGEIRCPCCGATWEDIVEK